MKSMLFRMVAALTLAGFLGLSNYCLVHAIVDAAPAGSAAGHCAAAAPVSEQKPCCCPAGETGSSSVPDKANCALLSGELSLSVPVAYAFPAPFLVTFAVAPVPQASVAADMRWVASGLRDPPDLLAASSFVSPPAFGRPPPSLA